MKFLARKGAPDIPIELIAAQESEDLIFFCGAGISSEAGLPDFATLVENVYVELNERKSDLEAEAIKEKLYDRALGLLKIELVGNNSESNLVRHTIINQLTVADAANLGSAQGNFRIIQNKKGEIPFSNNKC